MNSTKKGRNRATSGFSIAELLIAVGILLILLAVGVIAGRTIILNVRQSHSDKRAQAVYYAAQSRMMELFVTSEKTEAEIQQNGKTVTVSVVDELYNGNTFSYGGKDLAYVTSDDAGNIVFEDKSLSTMLGGSGLIIEYDPLSLDVYSVIICDNFGKAGTSLAGLTAQGEGASVRGSAQDRIRDYKGYVGYYAEGNANVLGAKVDGGLQAGAWIVNGRDLLGIVKITVDKETKDKLTNLSFKLTVRGPESSGQYAELDLSAQDIVWQNYQGGPDNNYLDMTGSAVGAGQRYTTHSGELDSAWFGDVTASNETYGLIGYIKLDSLDKDYHFKDLLASATATSNSVGTISPGNDISLSFKVWDSDSAEGISEQTRSASAVSNIENSLFADFDEIGSCSAAEIIYPRHLQNLDYEYSEVTAAAADGASGGNSGIAAVLEEDIDWDETANLFNGAVRNFTPISNDELISFTGERFTGTSLPTDTELQALIITSADSVDPDRAVETDNGKDTPTDNKYHVIEGLHVDTADTTYPIVGTDKNAGLFGDQSNAVIANLVIRDFAITNTAADSATGMLAGKLTGATVKNVFAYNRTVEGAEPGADTRILTGAGSTGGLIGSLEGGLVDACVVKNIEVSSTADAGGFAGAMNGSEVRNVLVYNEAAYDNNIIINGTGNAGGFIGKTEGGSVTGCGTAMYVEGGTSAGGFIGNSSGTTIDCCYAGGHTSDGGKYGNAEDHATPGRINVLASGDAGGFIGLSGGDTITNSYSTCSAKGSTRGGFIGNSSGGSATNCYATGMVVFEGDSAGVAAGGFIGSGSITSSGDYYFEIINRVDDEYVLGIGGTDENPDGIKALDSVKEADDIPDTSAYTYNNSVMVSQTQYAARKEHTQKYDDGLPSDFAMKFVYELANGDAAYDDTGDPLFFVYEHHGDWPRPETNIQNSVSNNLGAFNKTNNGGEIPSPYDAITARASDLNSPWYVRTLAEAVITEPIADESIIDEPIMGVSEEVLGSPEDVPYIEPEAANEPEYVEEPVQEPEEPEYYEEPAQEEYQEEPAAEEQPEENAAEQESYPEAEESSYSEAEEQPSEEPVYEEEQAPEQNEGAESSENVAPEEEQAPAEEVPAENTEETENTENTENIENTENTENTEGVTEEPVEDTKETEEEEEKEEKEKEEEEEEETYGEYSLEDEEHGITIHFGADAKIPKGAEVQIVDIVQDSEDYDYDQLTSDAAEAVELSPEEVASFKAIDISIMKDGKEIQPQAPVYVEIKAEKLYPNNELFVDDVISAVHMDEDEPQVIEASVTNETLEEEQTEENPATNEAADTVGFETEGFSVYILVQPLLQKQVKASDGNVYEITVDYDNASGIPAGAELVVEEIAEGSEEYQNYMEECVGELDSSDEDIWFAHAFDIYFLDPETEEHYQPSKDVSVSVQLMQDDVNEDREMSVVHFGDETEVVDCEVHEETLTFNSGSFSVYVVIGHTGEDEVKTPRVEFHFIDQDNTDLGSGLFSAAPYVFENKVGTNQTTEIIKNGETLEPIKNPPNKQIVDGSGTVVEEKYFFGWYIVNFDSENAGQITYSWSDDPDQVVFEKPITITPPTNGLVGDNVTWTINGVSGTGILEDDGCCHVYLVPIYEDYYFVNFHIGAKEDTTLRDSLLVRRFVVLGSDESVTIRIGDVQATSTDPTRKVFAGWETINPGYTTKTCYYSVDATTGEEIDSPGSTSGYYVTFNKTDFTNKSLDLYPVFAEARWINFNTGKSSNNAKYIPSQYILTTDSENSYYISSLPDSTEAVRSGYNFMGWYANATLDANGDITNIGSGAIQISNPDGSLIDQTGYAADGTTVIYKIEGGKLYLYKELDALTLYARWQEYPDTTYTVIIWKQKITDSKTATAAQKTYDYGDSFTNVAGISSSTLDQLDLAAYKAYSGGSYTGFHYARCAMSTDKLASDGTTVINVYYDRDLMVINFVNHPSETTNYSYTETNNTTGELYGYVDGNYYQLTRGSSYTETQWYFMYVYTASNSGGYRLYTPTETYVTLNTVGNNYQRYNRSDGSPANNPYDGTRYTRRGGNYANYRYTPTTATTGTQYGLDQNGGYAELASTSTTYYNWTYTDGQGTHNYEGKRYTRSSTSSLQWTGLYGQTFAQNGYSWDDVAAYSWNEQSGGGGTTQTMLNAFTQTANPYNLYLNGSSGSNEIRHYRQQLDKTYSQTDVVIAHSTQSPTNFNFNNKFDGFTVTAYSTNGEGFVSGGGTHTVTPEQRVNNLTLPFYVYHTRNSYTLTMDVNYPNDVGLSFPTAPSTNKYYSVLYEESFSRFSSTGSDYFAPNVPNNYKFDGWYEDKTGTTPFDFTQTMPAANKIIYAKWSPLKYRIMVDPNGGEIDHIDHGVYNGWYQGYANIHPFRADNSGYNRSQATYINATYGTLISEYTVERNYVPISDAAAATYTGTIYRYINTQYNGNDGSGLPSDLRNAIYVTEAEIDSYYQFYDEWTVANRDAGYTPDVNVLGRDAWENLYVSTQKYREKYPGENYKFLGWYKEGESMPNDFSKPVSGPYKLVAAWRLDGGYTVEYDPQFTIQSGGSSVIINGNLVLWRDPEITDSNYADGAETEILQQPTGITANGSQTDEYIFRGWRLVNKTVGPGGAIEYTPIESNVFYDPGDKFTIRADYADSAGKIYMQAYYEERDASYRRPNVANLTLDANTGFITLDGGTTELDTNTDLTSTWNGIGTVSATVTTPTGDTELVEFGNIQSSAEIDLHKYATDLQEDAAGNALTDSKNYFAHENGYFLLGFDDSSDEGDFIASYPADAVIAVQRTDAKTIYAVWEPLVYLNFVNDTNVGDVTFGLSSPDISALQVINVKNGIYDRTPITDINHITVREGETLKLAIPYGAGKNINITGTDELGYGTMLLWESDAAVNPSMGFVENGEDFSFTETPIVDPTGITVTFTSKQHDRTIVLHDNYGDDDTHEVYLSLTDVSTILPTTNTRLGYQFMGWARTPDAQTAEFTAANDYEITDLNAFFETEIIKELYAVWEARAEAQTVYVYKNVPSPGDQNKSFIFRVSFDGSCRRTNIGGGTINIPEQYTTVSLKHGEYIKIFSEKYIGSTSWVVFGTHPYVKSTITKYNSAGLQVGSAQTLEWEYNGNVEVNYNDGELNFEVVETDYTGDYYDTTAEVAAELTQGSIIPTDRMIEWHDSDAGGTVIYTNERQTIDVKVEKELITDSANPPVTNFNFTAYYTLNDDDYRLDDFSVTSGSYSYIRKVPVGSKLVITETKLDDYETEVEISSSTAALVGTFDEVENSFTFDVTKQDDTTVTFTNTLKSFVVTFYKVDGNKDPGVEAFFTLAKDTSTLGTLLYPDQTTGVFYPRPNAVNPEMYVGEYTLTETWVEPGFMLLEDDIIITISGKDDGTITSNNTANVKIEEEVVNGVKEFSIYIINSNGAEVTFKKIDGYGKALKNEGDSSEARFALYKTYDDALNAVVTDADEGTTFDEDDDKIEKVTITTGTGSNEVKEQKAYATQDDEGEVKFEIPAGTYYMKEVKAPDNYTFDCTKYVDLGDGPAAGDDDAKPCIYRIVVGSEAATDAGITLAVDEEFRIQRMKDATHVDDTLDVKEYGIMNISKKHERIILKKESTDGSPLEGATFDIIRPDRSYYRKNLSSGAAGGLNISDLPYGYYYLYESAAPSGYVGSGKYYKLTIDENGKTLSAAADSIEALEE
ncbi:SpaA isopeptide-forming pilin-related protein [Butyrivibrio sp. INlla16]|uniref:SpaA isopeptide-forming pilin-related protein n=1 Tax=Butyrivibrio sp. INlla16 TaxID=1520807 RepID=UPI00088CBE8D|nr:SpaA isopeptide-forming pilin-related protein [Butyrivibrio sp. INlla16]SDB14972.1 Listeria/Bacterioides repeat-containing protein [Butyrivibrio sp. INlla16]